MPPERSDHLPEATRDWIAEHARLYLSSGGTRGHLVDMSGRSDRGFTPTLLLKTIGRRSGRPRIVPLVYGCFGREWMVIASKGGSPDHPDWFLNLRDRPEIEFEIATQAFRGAARVAEGAERERVWDYASRLFMPWPQYQALAGDRLIPVVLLLPLEEIAPFTPQV